MTPHPILRGPRFHLSRLPAWARPSMLALALVVAGGGSGCSKDSPAPIPPPAQSQPDGAADGATMTDGPTTPVNGKDGSGTIAVDLGNAIDSQPPPTTCSTLRNCVTRCAADTACQQRCNTAATAAARTAYATVTTCSKAGCADFNDELCRCQIECMGDGACVDQVDECRAFDNDLFCEVNCGS